MFPTSAFLLPTFVRPFPGVFYQNDRPTKSSLEKKWIDSIREKVGNASDLDLFKTPSTE
jgi:hypothetical protein